MNINRYNDIVIIGGGITGMLMALALAKLDKKVTLIEKSKMSDINKNDNRSVALSYSSICILNGLGVWKKIKDHIQLIQQVHVSNKGIFGKVQLTAEDSGVDFLGAVVKVKKLLIELYKLLGEKNNVSILQGFEVSNLVENKNDSNFALIISNTKDDVLINAKVVIAADGAKSTLREKVGIETTEYNYKQTALVFDVELQRNNTSNTAYERFIDGGAIALLPINYKQMSCIWTVNQNLLSSHWIHNKFILLKELQKNFGYRLGRFVNISSEVKAFPLFLFQVESLYRKNLLLFGNASHFLHPISAQGLNLSIRDIKAMYDLFAVNRNINTKSVEQIFQKYEKLRMFDHKRTIALAHSIVCFFGQRNLPIKYVQSLALFHLGNDKFLRNFISNLMMGRYDDGLKLTYQKAVYEI